MLAVTDVPTICAAATLPVDRGAGLPGRINSCRSSSAPDAALAGLAWLAAGETYPTRHAVTGKVAA